MSTSHGLQRRTRDTRALKVYLLGNISIFPIPSFIFAISISESSGLYQGSSARHRMFVIQAYGKYKSVLPGSTSIFALMACIAARKLQ